MLGELVGDETIISQPVGRGFEQFEQISIFDELSIFRQTRKPLSLLWLWILLPKLVPVFL